MKSHVFLDESGDLGWKFDKPYRRGGSSRYITIGYLITPEGKINIPKRLVRDFYKKFSFNPQNEVKAAQLKNHHKEYICHSALNMLIKNPDFHLGAITTFKERVLPHIKLDGNKLYNFMISQSVIGHVEDHQTCLLTRDIRQVKVVSGSSCIDYLQTVVWFHKEKALILIDNPKHSHHDEGLIFIDWITNIVWSKYENGQHELVKILDEQLNEVNLFFP